MNLPTGNVQVQLTHIHLAEVSTNYFICSYIVDIKVTPALIASSLVGASIGAFISWIVNCTLIEVPSKPSHQNMLSPVSHYVLLDALATGKLFILANDC